MSKDEAMAQTLQQREQQENFPVAMRLLPRDRRDHLHALYAMARTIDEVGDAAAGDRRAQLLDLRAQLAALWSGGRPSNPVVAGLAPAVQACGLAEQPFQDLVEANLVDQTKHRYRTFDELLEYCRLSAVPVGRVVLAIFEQATPRTQRLSDDVCTALQLLEHTQDIAEDRRNGRIYLPADDLDTFGVAEEDLDAATASDDLRRLVIFETERARGMLDRGSAIVGYLRGWARIAVAGYVAGGTATAAALQRCRGDVFSATPRPRRRDTLTRLGQLLLRTPGQGWP
jgi:squalene synthase HpnC